MGTEASAPTTAGGDGDEPGAWGGGAATELRLGAYEHHKGNRYDVLGVARHSETGEALVVYRPRQGEQGLWVRPLAMFVEDVEVDGRRVPRFRPVDEG